MPPMVGHRQVGGEGGGMFRSRLSGDHAALDEALHLGDRNEDARRVGGAVTRRPAAGQDPTGRRENSQGRRPDAAVNGGHVYYLQPRA